MEAWDKLKVFLSEVKIETRKIAWPSLESLKATTGVVIVTSFIITIFVAIIDLTLSKILNLIMHV